MIRRTSSRPRFPRALTQNWPFTAFLPAVAFSILLIFWFSQPAFSQKSKTTPTKEETKKYQWTAQDLVTADTIRDYHISPNGKQLLYSVKQWDSKKHSFYLTLYLTDLLQKKPPKRLTYGKYMYSDIQWVPGENKISFSTTRKFPGTKPGNIWVLPLDGGESHPITKLQKPVQQYFWLTAKRMIFLSDEKTSMSATRLKKEKDTTHVVEDEDNRVVSRIFSLDIPGGTVKRLTDNVKPIGMFTVSPDKKHVLYRVDLSMRYGQDAKVPPKHMLLNLETGKKREVLKGMALSSYGEYYWALDGKGFYFNCPYNTVGTYNMASVLKVYFHDVKGDSVTEVDLQWDRYTFSLGTSMQPTTGGILVKLADGVRFKFAHYIKGKTAGTWKRVLLKGKEQANIADFKISEDGSTLVYAYSTSSLPTRYYLGRLKGSPSGRKGYRLERDFEVMDVKSPLFKRPLAKSEVRTWKGALDDTVEGILYYPYRYEAGKKYPLVLMIHGGPNAADTDTFSDNYITPAHMWCERQVFVLKVNYHGSTNYGIEFGESIAGHYYEYEVPDIEAGVDMLIGEGKVDKEKLAIIGHSNGAILGTALTVHSTRYIVASIFAGDFNWTSDYGNCKFGVSFDNYYLGGPPWKMTEVYIEKSPLFKVERVTTPTLLFHGDKDTAVPYNQSWEFYRAMQVTGKAPVRFLSFPGETHVPKKVSHCLRKVKEEIAWFEKYLFKSHKPANDSIKKGSPLEMLARIRKVSKEKGHYGSIVEGKLVPEIVTHLKIDIGRFEVTRAQWAVFDTDCTYPAGTGNYPVSGKSFADVKKYVTFVSTVTGKKYRLPNAEEAKKLYKTNSGNTFDYWAGYPLNPEDYKALLPELKAYGQEPVLLKPAGNFPPAGKALVFDLGGNAAELCTGTDGKEKVMGGSAYTPADTGTRNPVPLQYTGFRIVREGKAK
ncbi:MAG: prolyl oligopeptidase family serine peptidase [bacterium]|nr:prolyl oligopeptidase family serine peptidase [bacterium]